MKILSINFQPKISEGMLTIEGWIEVDSNDNHSNMAMLTNLPMKIELEITPIGPVIKIRGSSGNYSFRAELKNSQIDPISSFSRVDQDELCLEFSAEDLHRFSGFLDD